MKKKYVFAVIFGLLCVLSSCTKGNPNYTGEIVARGSMPEMIVIENEGTEYGFIIADETQIVFTDEVLGYIGLTEGEQILDYLGTYMSADVVAGKEAPPSENYISDSVKAWFYAEKVTVTEVHDDYFLVDGR